MKNKDETIKIGSGDKENNPFNSSNLFGGMTEPSNPFNTSNLINKDLTGFTPTNTGSTSFSRRQTALSDLEQSRKEVDKTTGFWSVLKNTTLGLPRATYDIAKEVATNPIQSAKEAVLGISNGLTLGGTDYLQKRAFENEARKSGLSEVEIKSLAENVLKPENNALQSIRGGSDFAAMVVPYAGIEKAFIGGLKFAAPQFVAKYARLAKYLTDIGAFNTAGQLEESFNGSNVDERVKRAFLDTTAATVFGVGGEIFRKIRGTAFKSPFEVSPVVNENILVPQGEVVSEEALKSGAKKRIDELSSKAFLKGQEPEELSFLKKNLNNPDELFRFNEKPPIPKDIPVQDAKTAVTIEFPSNKVDQAASDISIPESAVGAATKKISVATNDLEALQNYIKGSNEIDYKVVNSLGKDAKGNPIQARFEARGGVNGRPIIYATDETTASNLGHELGHFFDSKLTKSVDKKLSTLLPSFDKNRSEIEDTLGSFAIKNLGGNATSEQISKEIERIVSNLKIEIDTLSSLRRGSLINSRSERFADAVSEILTREGSSSKAPVLRDLIAHAEESNTSKIFSDSIKKSIESSKKNISENIVSVNGKTYELSGKQLDDYKEAKAIFESRNALYKGDNTPRGESARKAIGMQFSAKKREITGSFTQTEISNMIKKERSNYVGKKVEVEINGKTVEAIIDSKPSYGKTKVKLEDGNVLSVSNSQILKDKRLDDEIIATITKRDGVKEYNPINGDTQKPIESIVSNEDIQPKNSEPSKVIEVQKELKRTPTGKKPDSPAIRAEKITTDAETESFINTKILPKLKGTERIGKSNADIIERSYSSDLTQDSFDRILKERFGNLSEDVVKAKRILTDGAKNLQESLAGRSMQDLSGDEAKNIMSEYNRLVQTFEVFSGVRTELSNSFRSLGIGVSPGENDILRNALETIQKTIGDETDPFKIVKKIITAQEKGPVAKYFEVWYPAILSGPKTSIRNVVGNASNLTLQTLSKLFTKEGRSEFLPTVNSIIAGQKQAINNALSVLRGESTVVSKIVEGEALNAKTFSGRFAFLNNLEYVGRFLNAQDAYFGSLAKDAEISSLRKGAYTYGLNDKEMINAINESVGQGYSQMVTFRNKFEKTFVGEIASKVSSLKSSENEAVKSFANFFVPFVKTVANITDRRVDFLPIFNLARTFSAPELYEQRASRILSDVGFFDKMVSKGSSEGLFGKALQDFAKSENDRVKSIIMDRLRNQQLGRFYMGTAALASGIPIAIAGRITGKGPEDKNERDTLMASGWRPNSIIMPDGTALPYQNTLSSISSILSVLGNISDAVKYKKDKSSVSSAMIDGFFNYMKSELDQSFLSGISNIYDGLTGYTPKEQVLSNLAANAIPIPAAWSQTKDILFPERYVAKNFNEIIRNKLGITGDFFGTGITEPLQPNVNAFGEQTKADLIYGLTPPLLNSKKDDPVLSFMLDNGISVGKPNIATKVKKNKYSGESREMTKEEYTNYVKNSGARVYNELKNKIESGYFERFKTQEEKKDAINKIVTEIRTQERLKIKY